METKVYTPEIIFAMLGDITEKQKEVWQLFKETDRELKELKESQAKTDLHIDKLTENVNTTEQSVNKLTENVNKSDQKQAETWKQIDKLTVNVNNLNDNVGGIGNSNGDFAEDYFYNSFKSGQKTFFGEKFDDIERKVKGIKVGSKAEYDIVLLNGKTVGIIEVKYKGKLEYISKVLKKAETFRLNYPYYANHQIYLALASMSFEDEVEDKCIKEGIAVVKQIGDTVVINDKNLTAF
jgi:hypothetical protein